MIKGFHREGRLGCRLALACVAALATGGTAWAAQGAAAAAPPAGAATGQPAPSATGQPAPSTMGQSAAPSGQPAPPEAGAGAAAGQPTAPAGPAGQPAGQPAGSAPPAGGAAAPVTLDSSQVKGYEAAAVPVEGNAIVLTLDKAIEIGLHHNHDIAVARYNRAEARLNILAAVGYYDLLLGADLRYSDTTSPGQTIIGNTVFPSSSGKTTSWDLNVAENLPTGGTARIDFNGLRAQRSGQPVNVSPNLAFGISQPLLRNFGTYVTENSILVAQTNSALSRTQFQVQVVTSTQQIINAYWALVNARESLVVAQESLQLAKDLHERNRIQVEVGTLAPLEMVQSEAAIATRQEQILTAQQAIGDGEDQLRLLLNLPQGELWKLEIRPVTPPETERVQINLDEAIALGLANRPEVVASALNVDLAKINAAFARNQVLPQLNLIGGYGYAGSDTNLSSALRQITGLDFRSWNVELQFSFPVPNRQAKARSAVANLEVDKTSSTFDYEKIFVTNEVRTAARRVLTAAQQIDASHAARGFQEKNLDAERKRYENGMSTSFQITQIQDQLTQAKQAEVNAVTGYRTALAEYYRTIGRLLDTEGVVLVDPPDKLRRYTFHVGPLP
jgi:outer membrane protein